MGCDIHAMIEAKHRYRNQPEDEGYWVSCGRLKITRNYDLFGMLANVRNYGNWPFISNPRFAREDINECEDWYYICSEDFKALSNMWDTDAHSHSYVTMDELRLIRVADVDLADRVNQIVTAHGYSPEEARLVFFFDN